MKQSTPSQLGKGSIILIKGKASPDGSSRLYATSVDGYAQFGPNATMLFLSHEFYRIVKRENRLVALRIDYRNEESLKKVLNMKASGRLSIVKNNNKTPLHWKTIKHTYIQNALRDVESDLIDSSYLLESEGTSSNADFANKVFIHLLSFLFYGVHKNSNLIHWVDTENANIDSWVESIDEARSRRGSSSEEWSLTYEISIFGRKDLSEDFEKNSVNRTNGFTITFNSDADINSWNDPGDYWNPPDSGWDLNSITTTIESLYHGDLEDIKENEMSPELKELIRKINALIKDMDPSEVLSHINATTKSILNKKDHLK